MAVRLFRRLRSATRATRRRLRATVTSRSPQRLRHTISVYRGARRSLQALAGPALPTGTLAGVVAQIPGGALTDAFRWKRALAAAGILMIAASALILALAPSVPLVFFAEVLHGLTAGIVPPAIAAISLGIVGRRAMSARTGRNYRFDAAGNALTAGAMGLAGDYFRKSAIFLASAALCIPALFALSRIRGEEIDYARARNAGSGEKAKSFQHILELGKNYKLYIFGACVFLFQLAMHRCFRSSAGI